MDNFKAVYRILSALEKAMDLPEFDIDQIGVAALGVSEKCWSRYIEMMRDVGYFKGATIQRANTGELMVDAQNICITLKGLEFLQENGIMRKVYNDALGRQRALIIGGKNLSAIKKIKCPCCGKGAVAEYEVCDFCSWENDPIQHEKPDYKGGANKMSLKEARNAYLNGKAVR